MTHLLRQPLAELPPSLALPAPPPPFTASIRPPGSKSLTNRALLLAALARGTSTLRSPLFDAEDAERMLAALRELGARTDTTDSGAITVEGVNGRWRTPEAGLTLNLANAGTATRFLAAAAILSPAPITIDGNARMRERPIGELSTALRSLGVGVDYLGAKDRPPLRLDPPERPRGTSRALAIPTTLSSQFISALLLVAPWLELGITLRLVGQITSPSYVEMTVRLLSRLGASVQTSDDYHVIRVGPPRLPAGAPMGLGLNAFDYTVEPDASGATYFWAAAAMVPGASCTVLDLPADSLQGDAQFTGLLAAMGAHIARHDKPGAGGVLCRAPQTLQPVVADMSRMPDAAMTIASVACFAQGTSILRGLRTLRVKETDRIAAMQKELAKVGVTVRAGVAGDEDAIAITPPRNGVDCSASVPPVAFDTYDDHRMAMSLALVALRRPNITINDPVCVAKTYPRFWQDFARLYQS